MLTSLCHRGIFEDYILTVLILSVMSLRDRTGLENEKAVLWMDAGLPYTSERVHRLWGENNTIAITCSAHTWNVFQGLDLVFFGVLTKLRLAATGEFDGNSTPRQSTKLIQVYVHTAVSSTIRGSFCKARLEPHTTTRSSKLWVVEDRIRENRGCQDMWTRDISSETPSASRRARRFGIVNSEVLFW
jgi:hypothetical protein